MRQPFRFASLFLAICTCGPAQEADPHAAHHHGAMLMPGMDPGVGDVSGWYGSGTSLVPRSTPQYMLHKQLGAWTLMFNGVFFGVYSNQTGPRGRDKIFSPNWLMPMASRKAGIGTLTLRSMLSFEEATITNKRYPLLFQTGETANGIPIVNGQHPHDLFMELAASYQIKLGEKTALTFYGGPRAEPALGPTAFPHRISASENPMAVLSHHHQDSTHISASVVTAGLTYGRITVEASGFHGREPDEKRWGMEPGAIDSFSARLSLTPTSRWSGQFSMGRINNREATHPLRDTLRTTASAMYVRRLARGHWASSVIWGRNNDLAFTAQPTPSPATATRLQPRHIVTVPTRVPREIYNSYLAESTVRWRSRNWAWGRAELVDKDSTLLYEEAPFLLLVDERRFARIQAYTGGYEREVPALAGKMGNWLMPAIGGQMTVYNVPSQLSAVYGQRPVGVQVFLRVRMGSWM